MNKIMPVTFVIIHDFQNQSGNIKRLSTCTDSTLNDKIQKIVFWAKFMKNLKKLQRLALGPLYKLFRSYEKKTIFLVSKFETHKNYISFCCKHIVSFILNSLKRTIENLQDNLPFLRIIKTIFSLQ
jgi:hypothetical protein